MIVKVQISQFTSHGNLRVLVYNEDRTIQWEDGADSEVLDFVQGRPKVYAEAHMEGTIIVLDKIVEDQDW